jgi:hypothetical protein
VRVALCWRSRALSWVAIGEWTLNWWCDYTTHCKTSASVFRPLTKPESRTFSRRLKHSGDLLGQRVSPPARQPGQNRRACTRRVADCQAWLPKLERNLRPNHWRQLLRGPAAAAALSESLAPPMEDHGRQQHSSAPRRRPNETRDEMRKSRESLISNMAAAPRPAGRDPTPRPGASARPPNIAPLDHGRGLSKSNNFDQSVTSFPLAAPANRRICLARLSDAIASRPSQDSALCEGISAPPKGMRGPARRADITGRRPGRAAAV